MLLPSSEQNHLNFVGTNSHPNQASIVSLDIQKLLFLVYFPYVEEIKKEVYELTLLSVCLP
jgi:hypothetical protein